MEADAGLLRNLGTLLAWSGAFILAYFAHVQAQGIANALKAIPLLGSHLGFLADAIESYIAEPLNDVVKKSEAEIAAGFHGLVNELELWLGVTLLLGVAFKDLIVYLWNTALDPRIHAITNAIRTTAHSALAKVEALADTVADNVTSGERYARGQATGALSDAKVWARAEIDSAKAAATSYADDAVAKLRRAEDAAIGDAVSIATAAKTAATEAVTSAERYTRDQLAAARTALDGLIAAARAGAEHTAADALATARSDLGASIDAARSDLGSTVDAVRTGAAAAVADAITRTQTAIDTLAASASSAITDARTAASGAVDALSDSARGWATTAEQNAEAVAHAADLALDKALATVRATAVGAATDLNDLVGPEGLIGAAALIASIPALATLVHAIADEAGLGRAECRSKVRGVCTTDPAAWEGLLIGLGALGFAFSLRELVAVARPLVAPLATVLEQAA